MRFSLSQYKYDDDGYVNRMIAFGMLCACVSCVISALCLVQERQEEDNGLSLLRRRISLTNCTLLVSDSSPSPQQSGTSFIGHDINSLLASATTLSSSAIYGYSSTSQHQIITVPSSSRQKQRAHAEGFTEAGKDGAITDQPEYHPISSSANRHCCKSKKCDACDTEGGMASSRCADYNEKCVYTCDWVCV